MRESIHYYGPLTMFGKSSRSPYSKGVFLRVVGPFARSWQWDWDQLRDAVNPEHVELWLEHLPTRAEISELMAILNGIAVVVHGPFVGMSFATPWEDLARISIDRARRTLEVCAELNARVVTFHAGTYPTFEEPERVMERLARRLIALIAEGDCLLVTVENMPRRGGAAREALTTTRDLTELGRYLQDIQFTLDVGHCVQNGDEYVDFLLGNSARIANIHLHDGFCGGAAHRALGVGELELGRLISALDEVGYAAYVGIETLGLADTKKSWNVLLTEEARTRGLHGEGDLGKAM